MWTPSEHLDPFLERRQEARPWEIRAAQWRAWALAVEAFGNGARVFLGGKRGLAGFRGHFWVEVPFVDIADHLRREALFLAWVRRDPVFLRVPLIFLFRPVPFTDGQAAPAHDQQEEGRESVQQ